MKLRAEKAMAQTILDAALFAVKSTVGKSFPLLIHEVELPDSIKKEYLHTGFRDTRPEDGLEQGAFSM